MEHVAAGPALLNPGVLMSCSGQAVQNGEKQGELAVGDTYPKGLFPKMPRSHLSETSSAHKAVTG